MNEVLREGQRADWDTESVVDVLADFTLAGIAGLPADVLDRADRAPVPHDPEGS